MISKTFTGITFSNIDTTLELPCSINDTFIAGTPLNFCTGLSQLNSLLGTSINSGNISTFSLFVRIITETTTDTFISAVFSLSSANIVNNCIVRDISALTNQLNNELIRLHSTETDIHNLNKKYRIAFRVFLTANGIGNQSQLLTNDIVSNLTICYNTFESGPYDVEFSQIDLFSPTDFTTTQRNNLFRANPGWVMVESVRAFFPSNMTAKAPLIVYTHGNNQYTEGIDSYLSTFASYGYFCISVNHFPDSDNPKVQPHKILTLIDHFKQNKDIIDSGRHGSKINFNKIIFSGLSRGGLVSEAIPLIMKKKNSLNSGVSNISIDYTDIKAIISIGDVANYTVGDDGIISMDLADSSSGFTFDPNQNDINYFTIDHDVPIIKILGFNDNQSRTGGITNTMFNPGFSYTNKLNNLDKYALFSYFDHNQIVDLTAFPASNAEKAFGSFPTTRVVSNHLLNSNRMVLNEYIAWTLYFLAINCFDSNKLKKLRFIDPKKQKINNILKNEAKTISFHTFFTKADDIQFQLHNFYGLTMSLAGTTGFTLSNPSGFTFDYCYDSSYYTTTNTAIGQTYIDNLKEMKAMWVKTDQPGDGFDLTDNDTFNGIQLNSYKSLFVPIESDISLGFTFQSNLNLSENNYIGLRACQTYIFGSGITTNSKYSNFNLTLIDANNNSSTLSSRNYSNGFYPQIDINTNPTVSNLFSTYPTVPNTVFFRAGDFVFKNNSVGITQIKQMRLDFGPSRGSTFSHIAFDDFVVYKEL